MVVRRQGLLGALSLRFVTAAVTSIAVSFAAAAVYAQSALSNQAMRSVGDAPQGLPIETFAEKPLPLLAREMLLKSHLDDHSNVPRPQQRGLQVELFAPGDFGLVVRYRW